MAAVIRAQQTALFRRIFPLVSRIQNIATTPNKNDDVAAPVKTGGKSPSAVQNANWITYGFDAKDETRDRNATHNTFFMTVTICLVLGGYIYSYKPDITLRDWAQREAYLEIRRREEHNLPLIDPNLIDVSKVHLPSDEELGNSEIII